MTEIRPVGEKGLGLFATQAYLPGQVILEETPIFVFAPQQQSDHDSLKAMFRRSNHNKHSTGSSVQQFIKQLILLPNNIPAHQEGKFYGMLLALVTYAAATLNANAKLLDDDHALWKLYSPVEEPLTEVQRNILFIAKEVLRTIQPHVDPNSPLFHLLTTDSDKFIHIMLLWSYNAFQDGLVLEQISRVNHSCDPNALVREDSMSCTQQSQQKQQLVATCHLQPGDEIYISYLGMFTFAGYTTRQEQLLFSKQFYCSCSRCSLQQDPASAIPCPVCHPRLGGKGGRSPLLLLHDSLHYDDFHEPLSTVVQYAIPLFPFPPSDSMTPRIPASLQCGKCGNIPITTHTSQDMIQILNWNEKVIQRITTHLASSTPRLKTQGLNHKDTQDLLHSKMEFVEELFHLSSSVLGARHWCTILLSLQALEQSLASLHAAMLFSHEQDEGGEPLDLVQLAECIDSLQKLWTYFELLQLKSHPGHVLSGVTIGVARTLVSLGDAKSKKYGAEWVEKIESYIQQGYEGESMTRVVETLKSAWLKTTSSPETQALSLTPLPQAEGPQLKEDGDDDKQEKGATKKKKIKL